MKLVMHVIAGMLLQLNPTTFTPPTHIYNNYYGQVSYPNWSSSFFACESE